MRRIPLAKPWCELATFVVPLEVKVSLGGHGMVAIRHLGGSRDVTAIAVFLVSRKATQEHEWV